MINYYWVSIKGKNVKYYLNSLFKNQINIEKIIYKDDEILVKVSYNDYKKMLNIKTSCIIKIIEVSGMTRLRHLYQKYKVSLFVFVISVFFIIFMCNTIFYISILTDNNDLKNLVIRELKNNGIYTFSYRKPYNSLNEIANKIKKDNLTRIEWIELEQKGVFLYVKIIPRINKVLTRQNMYHDIVAAKDGYIRRIHSRNGQILKNIDDYVKKDEIIISGNIFKNDKVIGKTNATGEVYADVWYTVKVSDDLYYKDLTPKKTGKIKLSYLVNGKEYEFFHFPWKVNTTYKKVFFSNNNFSLSLKRDNEYYYKNEKYNVTKLQKILETKARKEVLNNLDDNEYIILQKTLKKSIKNGKMYIEVFFECYENIALSKNIQEIKEKKDD